MGTITRRSFLGASAAFAALAERVVSGEDAVPPAAEERGIRVRFLGSGAAGWRSEWAEKNPNARRQSSVLLDGKVLIDFTSCSFDKLPKECHPEVLFQTHSHGDHYSPRAAVKSGVKRLYVQESWAAAARHEVGEAATALSLPAPEVIALPFGKAVKFPFVVMGKCSFKGLNKKTVRIDAPVKTGMIKIGAQKTSKRRYARLKFPIYIYPVSYYNTSYPAVVPCIYPPS